MKVEVSGKDKNQIVSVNIGRISPDVLKVIIYTKDKWIGLCATSVSVINDISSIVKFQATNNSEDQSENYDIQINLISENEIERKSLNGLVFSMEDKDQCMFVIINKFASIKTTMENIYKVTQ